MAGKNNLIEQMLEHLVNDDQQKAEELFHDYVVAKSREIYEGLIESEIADSEDEDEDEEEVEEAFGDDEGKNPFGGDATDDLEGELDAEDEMGGEEEAEASEEELFQDLDAIVDQLQAKFDELKGIEGEEHGDDFGDEMGDDEEMKDSFELSTVREYVEKVPAGHGAEKKGQSEKADNKKSTIDNMKNDMGGTTANILSGRNGADAGVANGGELKGSGLLKGKPQDLKSGNINVPGGKAGSAFSKKVPAGHGAEKKGSAEGSTDGQSLFRGRR